MKITKFEPDTEKKISQCTPNYSIKRVAAYCRVSTDTEEQKNSYHSQIQHYTDLINANPEWELYEVYADEALSGTSIKNREGFNCMISDAMEGKFDLVITKSISRFARNTVDTLTYVRKLKDKNIPVIFENEGINTSTMDGELLLTILSSVAQQEVENTSANVKKGLYAKMARGELVGFVSCIGYDYSTETKQMTINQEEAELVRYIFDKYESGMGGSTIARELNNLGLYTRKMKKWSASTVIGVIKNEKYVGDLRQGKTFTKDPITKKRMNNINDSVYYIAENHHEPIISRQQFERCQEILKTRQFQRISGKHRDKNSQNYTFSCMLKCAYCGKNYSRRSWHGKTQYARTVWACVTSSKHGKENCPHSKQIPEDIIEDAFVKSYNLFCGDNKAILEDFLRSIRTILDKDALADERNKINKEIKKQEKEKSRIVDLYLKEKIDIDEYTRRYDSIKDVLEQLLKEKAKYISEEERDKQLDERIKELKKQLENKPMISEFSSEIFRHVVEKVYIGGYDENGVEDPYRITFVYKTGFKDSKKVSTKKNSVPIDVTTHVETVCILSRVNA